MNFLKTFAPLVLAIAATSPVRGECALYINYAPDTRYSANGHDSRISFDLEEGLYGYGHDYGEVAPCSDGSTYCITFDFMALHELPDGAEVGSAFVDGEHAFKVAREVEIAFLGAEHSVFRVDVAKNGKHSNSYLIHQQLGVVAIIVPNFGNESIPESVFLLKDRAGIFAKRDGI